MSILTAANNKVSPSAAGAATLTAGGAPSWTAGAWVEFMASTAAALSITGLTCWSSGASSDMEVEIGVGAVGVEVLIGTVRWYQGNPGAGGPGHLQLPVPIAVSSGVRLACRGRSITAGNDVHAKLQYVEASDNSTTAVLHDAPSHANQNTLTPSGTAWNNSSWQEVVSALTDPSGIAGFSIRFGIGEQDYEWDIGIGAGGAETVITTLRGTSLTQTSSGNQLSRMMLPFVYLLDATTRVAVRMRKTGTDVTTWNYAMMYYGDLEAPADPLQKMTQLVVLVGVDEYASVPPTENDCTGGGTVVAGSNPSAGTLSTDVASLHARVRTTIGGTAYSWAGVAINHTSLPASVRVESYGKLSLGIVEGGGIEGVSMTVKLFDHDNLLRNLHSTQTMLNQSMIVEVADLTTIIADGTWTRKFRGVIRKFRPTGDGGYEITIEDPLTLAGSAFAQDKMVPVDLISMSDGTADQGLREVPIPEDYGSLTEDDGAVIADYIGTETIPGHEDLGNMHKYLLCRSPTTDIQAVKGADAASGDPPTVRSSFGAADYGVNVFCPHQAGWIFSPDEYSVDADTGFRLTFIYLNDDFPAADFSRFGIIPLTVNFCARDDVGDGNGNTIDKLVLQDLHYLNNSVLQKVLDTDWLAQAARDSYSILKTSSWETVAAVFAARIGGNGALGATVIGHSHKQISLRDRLEQAACYGYFERFWNNDGQMEVTTLDRTLTGSSAVHFTAERDIKENSFSIDPRDDQVENYVQYVYRRKYATTLELPTPEEGSRLPPDTFQADWFSGIQFDSDATSIAALASGTSDDGIRKSKILELECVRDQGTAEDIAAQRKALRAPKNGRPEATFTVQLQASSSVKLGDIVKVTHPQGLGTGGWVARRCQVRRKVTDLNVMEETLTVRDVDDLLDVPAGLLTLDTSGLTWDAVSLTWT